MSGWATELWFQIKGTKDRGGYVKNIKVMDCQLQKITVFTAINYNNDGESAPEVPVFENYIFENIDLTGATTQHPVIDINGFKDPDHQLKKVVFKNIVLPNQGVIQVTDASNVEFLNVSTFSGIKPTYKILNSTDVKN